MKSKFILVLLFLGIISFTIYAKYQQPKEYTVTLPLNQWAAINGELMYAKDRAVESNLTSLQQMRIDSSITQIVRIITTQVNKQLADTTKPKK